MKFGKYLLGCRFARISSSLIVRTICVPHAKCIWQKWGKNLAIANYSIQFISTEVLMKNGTDICRGVDVQDSFYTVVESNVRDAHVKA